jgi:hypothetical protein
MKTSTKVSLALVAIPTAIYTVLSVVYYETDWRAIPLFLYTLIWSALPAAALLLLLWIWPFKKIKAFVYFSSALVFFAFMMIKNISVSKELDRKAISIKEMDFIATCGAENDPQKLLQLKNRIYLPKDYGDLTAALVFRKDYLLFFNEEEECRHQEEKALDFTQLIPPLSLNTKDKIIEARNRLGVYYNKLLELERRSFNYNSNLLLIFKESRFKNSLLKKEFLSHFETLIENRLAFIKDLYNVLIHQAYLLDDLLVFLFNRVDCYTVQGEKLLFDSSLDVDRYDYLLDEYFFLLRKEQEVLDQYKNKL